ncbi:MAG: DUF481 domain-containing protein [Myxococcales bacterium]|nr:DUF481 domain-containing protein [Myxococcales bacterium]
MFTRLSRPSSPALTASGVFLAAAGLCCLCAPRSARADGPTAAPQFSAAAPAKASDDKTTWTLGAGGVLNTGNTQSWSVNAGSAFGLVRGPHQFTANAAFNYGQANAPDDTPDKGYQDTVKNLNLDGRYDYYFTKRDAVWVAAAERWDTFANFDTQFRAEGGYLRVLCKTANHSLTLRLGYSYTYELYHTPLVDKTDMTTVLGDHQSIHGALFAFDSTHKISDDLQALAGFQLIDNLNDLDIKQAKAGRDVRIDFHAEMTAKLMKKLSGSVRFQLLYDRVPASAKKLDTATTVNLLYTLL